MPDLSVVVAAEDAGPHLANCMEALIPQLSHASMEILVADGSGQGQVCDALARDFPAVRVLRCPAHQNVPQLWRAGIQAARGKIVALTIENCIPAPDWAQRMLSAHRAGPAGIGGAIEITPAAGIADWAVYFCRYSHYMLPFAARFLEDLPADNCSYKREALQRVETLMEDGFWETFIHYDMRGRNEQLLSDPSPVVTYYGGLSAWRFLRRRYLHGRYFAGRRGRKFTATQRLLRGAAFFAVPPLLLNRIARRVWRNGRHRTKFLVALPLVMVFLVAWAAGECAGYLGNPSTSWLAPECN